MFEDCERITLGYRLEEDAPPEPVLVLHFTPRIPGRELGEALDRIVDTLTARLPRDTGWRVVVEGPEGWPAAPRAEVLVRGRKGEPMGTHADRERAASLLCGLTDWAVALRERPSNR